METSSLPVSDCKFFAYAQLSRLSLACHTYCDKRTTVYNGHLQELVALTPFAERLAVELSQRILTTGLSRLGFGHLTFRLRGELSNPLRHCRRFK